MSEALSLKQRFQLSRFIKGEASVSEPVKLNHRRIFILPSSRGYGFCILILLLFLVALVYSNNLTYILAYLLSSIFFVSILHSFKSMAGLVIKQNKTKNVFAGDATSLQLHIKNNSSHPRLSLNIKTNNSETVNFDIAAHQTAHITLYENTSKRGLHQFGTVTLFSSYPFGLFRCWSPVNFDAQSLIYPEMADKNLPYPEQSSSAQSQKGHNKTGNDDYYGLDNYQKGDPVRRIHWKAYAKGQGLFIKQYSGTSAEEIWLDYANTPGNHTEQRLSQLCRWVVEADQAAIQYGFKIPGLELKPSKGAAHYTACLEALALFGA